MTSVQKWLSMLHVLLLFLRSVEMLHHQQHHHHHLLLRVCGILSITESEGNARCTFVCVCTLICAYLFHLQMASAAERGNYNSSNNNNANALYIEMSCTVMRLRKFCNGNQLAVCYNVVRASASVYRILPV